MERLSLRTLSVDQEKAARIIAIKKRKKDADIAEELGIPVAKLRKWKKQANFKLRVLQILDSHLDKEHKQRTLEVSRYLKPVYKEIRRKLKVQKNLKSLSLKELLRMMTLLHSELRQESAYTKRLIEEGVIDFNDVSSSSTEDDVSDDILSSLNERYEAERKSAAG